ncbi:MAG: hypothetical protein CME64_15470 [Halobacteriovoraceae bacterium]|nr:hypothetical protein [Halobacteriovoraceae bacterium]|tara:strand:- start:141671 stop:142075 length:405 start_codon:yes stop_codon:yes gene_type:complete
MKRSCMTLFTAICGLLLTTTALSREHQIYSIMEEVPMGYENEVNKKNYYVNIGQNQGVEQGTVLDVYRVISKLNPYENQKRINHRVKIGELKVLHADEEAAIGALEKLNQGKDTPLFEIENFMIGDHVSVSVND